MKDSIGFADSDGRHFDEREPLLVVCFLLLRVRFLLLRACVFFVAESAAFLEQERNGRSY